MRPDIDQSKNSGNRRDVGKRFRRRAAEMFDPVRHEDRKMIEGIFGGVATTACCAGTGKKRRRRGSACCSP